MTRASEERENGRFVSRPVLLSALLFLLALGLRLLAVGRYVTPDELIWVYRSVLFRQALLNGQWADTLVAGHPGVTTTWLGAAAISVQLALQPAAAAAYEWVTRLAYLTPDNMEAYRRLHIFLDSGRTAVAIANSLGVVGVFWLARALFNGRIALIAALLLSIDPFFAGLSGLLHVDGLLTTWSTLALLALALGAGFGGAPGAQNRRFLWLALSGAAAALAVLSKTPGLLLLPLAALALLSPLWRARALPIGRRLALVTAGGAFWLSGFAATLLLLFPALWASPQQVWQTLSGNTSRHLDEALRPTFFMGDVAFDHGPLFYPVVLAWRLAPLVFGGLLLLLVLSFKKRAEWRGYLPTFLLLAAWTILFLAAISLAAKKFDRYALPVFPALAILAAVALAAVRPRLSGALPLLVLLLFVAQLAILAVSVPFLLAAYNPLVGGPYTAQMMLPLGWGEGVSAGGRWLSGLPAVETQAALSGTAPSLAPFFPGTTLFTETSDWQEADWVILTAGTRQVAPEAVARADRELELAQTVRYGLLPQAWIYRNPEPQRAEILPHPLDDPPSFGGRMRLLAEEIRQDEREVLVTARWQKEQDAPLLAQLRLRDDTGETWQEVETELLNEVYFYPEHWQTQETPQITYRLKLPPALPPGTYTVALTLIDQASAGQLPVRTAAGGPAGVVYEMGSIRLDEPVPAANLAELGMHTVTGDDWPGSDLLLLGYVQRLPAVLAGSVLPLELFWQVENEVGPGRQLALQLGDGAPLILPLNSAGEGAWQPGWLVRQRYLLPVPPDTPPGVYPVRVLPLDDDGQALPGARIALGEVRVDALDRLFSLPDEMEVPLQVRFEPGIVLRGVLQAAASAPRGGSLPLTLVWQAEGNTAEPVTAFIHLLDARDEIVAQADRWPGGLPSDIWSPGQVIVDTYQLGLPGDLAPGTYRLAVGLYTAGDGARLPAFDSAGARLAADRYLLPLAVTITE